MFRRVAVTGRPYYASEFMVPDWARDHLLERLVVPCGARPGSRTC
jgi:hypothetical protein